MTTGDWVALGIGLAVGWVGFYWMSMKIAFLFFPTEPRGQWFWFVAGPLGTLLMTLLVMNAPHFQEEQRKKRNGNGNG